MEARIRRLAFEKERAQKLTEIANSKSESLLAARERHHKQINDKLDLQQKRMEQEMQDRIKNTIAREETVAKKNAHLQNIHNRNNVRNHLHF